LEQKLEKVVWEIQFLKINYKIMKEIPMIRIKKVSGEVGFIMLKFQVVLLFQLQALDI